MAERTASTGEVFGGVGFIAEFDDGSDVDALRTGVARAAVSVLMGRPGGAVTRTSVERFRQELEGSGLIPEFIGRARRDAASAPDTAVAVFRGPSPPAIDVAPPSFTVVAIIFAYNEEDVIEQAIAHLVANGVGVYLVDNWSTDSTVERALRYEGDGLVGIERFPPEGRPASYQLERICGRLEELALTVDADWVVSNDADEFRQAPWPRVPLRDALFHVQTQGYSAVNHTCLNFALTQDTFVPGCKVEEHLSWFEPERVTDLSRLNCWRRQPDSKVELAWSGGHTVRFPERAVFPYNFLIRHYPIRSVEQGQRKVFAERLPRFRVNERLRGWHSHYDSLTPDTLLQATAGLLCFDDTFDEDFLLERLVGVGFDPSPVPVSMKLRLARVLRQIGVLDSLLTYKWRHSGRAARLE